MFPTTTDSVQTSRAMWRALLAPEADSDANGFAPVYARIAEIAGLHSLGSIVRFA